MALAEKKIYPKWNVEIHGGEMIFEKPNEFKEHLIPYEGKQMTVTLKNVFKSRSRQEEKYYHAVPVRMIAAAMDVADQEAHEFLKQLFLTVEEQSPAGFRYTRTMSTTELSDKAYRDYWESIIRWAAQPTLDDGLAVNSGLELSIPYPNEVDYENY
jgi:hypothetical protein